MGEDGFRHDIPPSQIKELKRLEKENELLKKLLAEKLMEGRLKDALIIKKYACARKGK